MLPWTREEVKGTVGMNATKIHYIIFSDITKTFLKALWCLYSIASPHCFLFWSLTDPGAR